jgi:hypothetical protein
LAGGGRGRGRGGRQRKTMVHDEFGPREFSDSDDEDADADALVICEVRCAVSLCQSRRRRHLGDCWLSVVQLAASILK